MRPLFTVVMGWFRFVCSNGLIIGVTQADVRRVHTGNVRIEDIGKVLTSGLKKAETEKKNFERWRKKALSLSGLTAWIEMEIQPGTDKMRTLPINLLNCARFA